MSPEALVALLGILQILFEFPQIFPFIVAAAMYYLLKGKIRIFDNWIIIVLFLIFVPSIFSSLTLYKPYCILLALLIPSGALLASLYILLQFINICKELKWKNYKEYCGLIYFLIFLSLILIIINEKLLQLYINISMIAMLIVGFIIIFYGILEILNKLHKKLIKVLNVIYYLSYFSFVFLLQQD